MLLSRDEDRQSLLLRRPRQAPLHAEAAGDRLECLLQIFLRGRQVLELEFDASEEDSLAALSGVLVEMDNVGAAVKQKVRDRGDDTRTVRARDQQPPDVLSAQGTVAVGR